MMLTLDDIVVELADHYDGYRAPSLLARLDNPLIRTSQPWQVTPGRSTPRSRPPVALDAVSWAARIKVEAVALDRELRGSALARPWVRAILDLPVITPDDQWRRVHSAAGRWRSTCLTVLGFQAPSEKAQDVVCWECRQATIVIRADIDNPGAWCTNPDCVDEVTGEPARYFGPRLGLLTRNRRVRT